MRVSCHDLKCNGLTGDQQGMETWIPAAAASSYSISFSKTSNFWIHTYM